MLKEGGGTKETVSGKEIGNSKNIAMFYTQVDPKLSSKIYNFQRMAKSKEEYTKECQL